MKINYCFILLFLIQIAHSQSETKIFGKVLCNDFPITKVDVINMDQNKVAVTNNNGEFQIIAKIGDELAVFLNGYYNFKILISQNEFKANWLQINLVKRPIELEDITVSNKYKPKNIFSQAAADEINLYKNASTPKVIGVYDGSIPNGMDFIRIGKGIGKLIKDSFGKKDKPKKQKVIKFKDYINLKFNDDFYLKTLKLKAEDIISFKEYCDSDKQSIVLMNDINFLIVYDFLLKKSELFIKMRAEKN